MADISKIVLPGDSTEYNLKDSRVPSDAVFTDTVTTVSVTGSGNAVTDITASNGALTVTKGSTFCIPRTYTISVSASNWSSSAPYTQTITQSGILSTDYPICDIDTSSATALNILLLLECWSMISNISTDDGSITIKCLIDKPTLDMSIIIKAV